MTNRAGYRPEFWRALNLFAEASSIARSNVPWSRSWSGVPEMLEQARMLSRLAPIIDQDHLRRTVAEECSSIDLLALLQEPP